MLELLKEYGSKKLDLLKMEATEKGVLTVGTIINFTLMAIFGMFFLILFNIGIALLIGYYLANYSYGVLIVAGFYLLLLLIVLIFNRFIKLAIANKILKTLNK